MIERKQNTQWSRRKIPVSEKVIENNRVCVIGEIAGEFTFSHEVFGEGFRSEQP